MSLTCCTHILFGISKITLHLCRKSIFGLWSKEMIPAVFTFE